jgi:ubiquinone/menaquinone biosynthesis C-methylase UbiE
MWFLRKSNLEPLGVAISGVKLGDRLLVVGGSDPALIAALATKAGLTGRTCLIDASPALVTATAAAVEREGALIESFTGPPARLPFDAASFDICVVRSVYGPMPADERRIAAAETFRVLRPGGRTVIVEDAPRGGFGGLFSRDSADRSYRQEGGAAHVLQQAAFRGVRTLAEREGLVFVEGTKPAPGR